jgi:OOP family OmpA-OmpF porin
MELSKNRVITVQNYLVDKGVAKSRIRIFWKGETEPIATNNTEEGREKNRRVEIIILTDE